MIPDLAPDVTFPLLPRDESSLHYSYEVKRAAMGPHIAKKWGWDDALQQRLHRDRFDEKPFFKIARHGHGIGTVSLAQSADHLRFGEFYLLPDFQRQGIGSLILRHCLQLADAQCLPVRLEYLKWNPVGSLYGRHGFVVTGETEIHWLMERPRSQTRMPKDGSKD
jgi:GNAT superfamily N-acetyltransferase